MKLGSGLMAVTIFTSLVGAALPQQTAEEREAIRFERAKAAAAAAQARKVSPSAKQQSTRSEGVREAIQFERKKLAAAAAQQRKEEAAERASIKRKGEAARSRD
jgi:hypothetical protein